MTVLSFNPSHYYTWMYIIVIWLWMTLPPPILQRLLPSLLLEHNFASTNYKILHQIASKRPRASKSSQCDLAFQNTPTSEQLSLSQIFPNVTIYPKFHSYGNQPSLCHNFVTCLVMYTPKCQEGMYSGQSVHCIPGRIFSIVLLSHSLHFTRCN